MNFEDFNIVEFSEEHLKNVAELEAMCFSSPISETNLKALLIGGIGKAFVFCDKKNNKVAAYGGIVAAAGEAQVLNIATHPDYRRRGLGRAIMDRLVDYSSANCAEYITLEVRENNFAAIALYDSMGFVTVGRIKNYYKNPTEDALILKKNLTV